jgi:hypothetical protein
MDTERELFTEGEIFNGFKCRREKTFVADMTKLELVGFIGMLDELYSRTHIEDEQTIADLRQQLALKRMTSERIPK